MPDIDCQTKLYEKPGYGRVLLVVLSGSECHEIVTQSCKVLLEALFNHHPRYVIIDLLGFCSGIGANTISFLVTAVAGSRKLGDDRKVRILAVGETADKVRLALRVTRMNEFYGDDVYPDIESALNAEI